MARAKKTEEVVETVETEAVEPEKTDEVKDTAAEKVEEKVEEVVETPAAVEEAKEEKAEEPAKDETPEVKEEKPAKKAAAKKPAAKKDAAPKTLNLAKPTVIYRSPDMAKPLTRISGVVEIKGEAGTFYEVMTVAGGQNRIHGYIHK